MRQRFSVLVFVCSFWVFGCGAPRATEATVRAARDEAGASHQALTWTQLEALMASTAVLLKDPPQVDTDPRAADYPYRCEEFEVHIRSDGRAWHKRMRRSWGRQDRRRFKALVEMVAQEMGADPRLISLWALRESTYSPDAIHVLNPDLEASARAWQRHRWDPDEAAALHAEMKAAGARNPRFWKAKARLSKIERFKENSFYDARVAYDMVLADGSRISETGSRWAYGYGAFGMNPAYFLPTWDATAPPWVFCDHDGIVAIVTAVWSARIAQAECAALGHGDRVVDVNRRFSRGHCEPSEHSDRRFRRRASRLLDPDARAKLGRKWPRESTERSEIIRHMRRRALEENLLPPSSIPLAVSAQALSSLPREAG